ncbi:hypothetical protein Efla_001908 [Eimeria flavescens]
MASRAIGLLRGLPGPASCAACGLTARCSLTLQEASAAKRADGSASIQRKEDRRGLTASGSSKPSVLGRAYSSTRDTPPRPQTAGTEASTPSAESSSSSSSQPEFIWRTTERRFIDFCLSPEDEQRLLRLHEKILASPWSSVSEAELAACLLPPVEANESQRQESFFDRLRRLGSYLLSPRGLEEDGRRLLSTAIPLYEDVRFTQQYFGIGKENYNARVYFLLLHVWLLHCGLQQAKAETLKIKVWDAFWDFLTNNLLREGASHAAEFKVPSILRDQQFVSLGFCVSLDEAFEDDSCGPAGQLAHRLWVTLFEAAEDKRDCPELVALATYAMRARSFVLQLPPQALVLAAFRWPAWPPVEAVQNAGKTEKPP